MKTDNRLIGIMADENKIKIKKKNSTDIIIALAGNPNVGKSTVFNALTGMNQHTGNWTGKTVVNAQGYCDHNGKGFVIIDLPGCYSLLPHSAEEEEAGSFIFSGIADLTAVVCDACCLERNLNLVLQILDVTSEIIVCVNLMDEAARKHIKIDIKYLEEQLGVPVIGMAARNGVGIDRILAAAAKMCEKPFNKEQKEKAEQRKEYGKKDKRIKDAAYYLEKAEEICRKTVCFEDEKYAEKDRKKDKILTGKYTAFPIMFCLLAGIFWLTIVGANYPSELLFKGFMLLENKLMELFIRLGVPEFFRELLMNGMFRVTAWVISVMLPPMAIFFPLFTILEDSGYLPRVAFNMDKCFKGCHACGKQSYTMCMGFGCNAAGVVGCRIIDSPRERLIAIITNSFVPCNGRFPTLIVVITMFLAGNMAGTEGNVLAALILAGFIILGIGMTLLVSRLLSATILKGIPSSFVLELPPYRRPQIGRVIVRSVFERTLFVLGRAVIAAAPAGIIIWLISNITVKNVTIMSYISEGLEPLGRLLGMDGIILMAFILGFPANEIVLPIIFMAYSSQGSLMQINDTYVLKELLVSNGWTFATAVSVILFSLMHWPCATTCLTIRRETGSFKWMIIACIVPVLAGALLCFLFTFIIQLYCIF